MYMGIEENEIAHYIDEKITYYSGDAFGYDSCWLFKCGELSANSKALVGLKETEREIGVGILKEIQNRAVEELNVDYIRYYVVPVDDVIDVYETYEHHDKNLI